MAQTEKPTGKNENAKNFPKENFGATKPKAVSAHNNRKQNFVGKKQTPAVETPKKKKQELPKVNTQKTEKQKDNIKEEPISEKSKNQESQTKESQTPETKTSEEKQEEKKKPIQKKPVVKKTETEVNGFALPFSTKDAIAVCRFIKHKNIDRAISDIESVIKFRKSVPMRGEIPHRKGSPAIKYGSGSGRFPIKTAKHFEALLKSLKANAENFEIENPVITLAVANFASRPWGRDRRKKKRTHVKIIAKEKNTINKNKKSNSEKLNKIKDKK